MAGLTLRWSLQRDLHAIPAPNRFGGSALGYRNRPLRRRRWQPNLRHQGRRLYWQRRRPLVASLLLTWSLRRDLFAAPAPSLRLDERRWRRQMNPYVPLWLMADILRHWPNSRLVRDHVRRLYCPQRLCRLGQRILSCRHCRWHRRGRRYQAC